MQKASLVRMDPRANLPTVLFPFPRESVGKGLRDLQVSQSLTNALARKWEENRGKVRSWIHTHKTCLLHQPLEGPATVSAAKSTLGTRRGFSSTAGVTLDLPSLIAEEKSLLLNLVMHPTSLN